MGKFREMQWLEGEEISHLDLTNISRYLKAQIWDTWAALARLDDTEAHRVNTVFSFGTGGAPTCEYPGAGLSVTNKAGVIATSTVAGSGDFSGTDAEFLPYLLNGGELNTVFAAADPSNPRWDLVCIAIGMADETPPTTRHFKDATSDAVTTGSVAPARASTIGKVVVTGTPASIPVIPSVPIGYAPWCAVLIPAGATNLYNTLDIIDYRFPVGQIIVKDVLGKDFTNLTTAAWTLETDVGAISADSSGAAAGHGVFAWPQGMGPSARLLSVSLCAACSIASPTGFEAGIYHGVPGFFVEGNVGPSTLLQDVSSSLVPDVPGALIMIRRDAPITGPIWGNGYRAGYSLRNLNSIVTGGGSGPTASAPNLFVRAPSVPATLIVLWARFVFIG